MKTFKKILLGLLAVILVVAAYLIYCVKESNPKGYATIGDIPAPSGYERISSDDAGYAEYLRSLPLKGKGSKVKLYTGGDAHLQVLSYAVVDMPLLSNAEQCADACIRLRAEYLYNAGRYGSIHFEDVNGKTQHYGGGASRKSFESYLRRVYGVASTFSLDKEMKTRKLKDMQPGDIFVYPATARPGHKLGHAIMVVDVAQNPKTGKKAFLLAEGNTPARDMHILNNLEHPFRSPWFILDEDTDDLLLSVFYYHADELKHF